MNTSRIFANCFVVTDPNKAYHVKKTDDKLRAKFFKHSAYPLPRFTMSMSFFILNAE